MKVNQLLIGDIVVKNGDVRNVGCFFYRVPQLQKSQVDLNGYVLQGNPNDWIDATNEMLRGAEVWRCTEQQSRRDRSFVGAVQVAVANRLANRIPYEQMLEQKGFCRVSDSLITKLMKRLGL